jgi:hypothetical protein
MQHFCISWRVKNLHVMVLRPNQFLKLAESIVSLHQHQAAQPHHRLSSLSTVYTSLLACHRQCQRRPISVAPDFHVERGSPHIAGNLIRSNNTILNTFKLHTRRIALFPAHPGMFNQLSIIDSMLPKIQSKSWMRFSTGNMLKTLQT